GVSGKYQIAIRVPLQPGAHVIDGVAVIGGGYRRQKDGRRRWGVGFRSRKRRGSGDQGRSIEVLAAEEVSGERDMTEPCPIGAHIVLEAAGEIFIAARCQSRIVQVG